MKRRPEQNSSLLRVGVTLDYPVQLGAEKLYGCPTWTGSNVGQLSDAQP